MGVLSYLIVKGAKTAATNATITAVGSAAADVISSASKVQANKEDAITKKGLLYIKPTRSSADYSGCNASDIAQELLGQGFENINLKPVKKLGQFSIKKYGTVCSISIGGKNSFSQSKKVPATSYIVIEYLDFKDGTNPVAYEKVIRIEPGKIQIKQPITFVQVDTQVTSSSVVEGKKFCCYCGSPIRNLNARFCYACGKEI